MNPDIFKPLFDMFSLPYPGAYMTLLFFSSLLTVPVMVTTARVLGLSMFRTGVMPLFCIPAGLVMSRVFSVLFDGGFSHYMEKLSENGISYLFTVILNPMEPGHVFFGGLFGGWLAGSAYVLYIYGRDRERYLRTADTVAFAAAMGLWITRIGCFFEGCCFGRICSWCGVHFPKGSRTMYVLHSVNPDVSLFEATPPLIPTQLIHSFSNLLILLFLVSRILKNRRSAPPGYYVFFFLFLYSVTRFFIEFLRYDPRGSFLFLSTSQWISLILLLLLFRYHPLRRGDERS